MAGRSGPLGRDAGLVRGTSARAAAPRRAGDDLGRAAAGAVLRHLHTAGAPRRRRLVTPPRAVAARVITVVFEAGFAHSRMW
jgi:hypothetical protein